MVQRHNSHIQQKIEQADIAKRANPLDLSSDQDLTIGIMNLIAIEDATATDDELHKMVSGIRTRLLSRIVPTDSDLFDVSTRLLGVAIRYMDMAAHQSAPTSYEMYDAAYGAYSAFWGLNMGMISIADVEKMRFDSSGQKMLECKKERVESEEIV